MKNAVRSFVCTPYMLSCACCSLRVAYCDLSSFVACCMLHHRILKRTQEDHSAIICHISTKQR
jgi:hypothetical protein